MRKITVLFITITLCTIFLQATSYGFSLNVSPPSVRLSIPPGGTESSTITIENKSDSSSIDMRAYVEDWDYAEDGSKQFHPPGTTPRSCARWINIYPKMFHLEPKARIGIQYTISVPQDAEGGHYAVIFFESIVGDDEAEGNLMVRFAGRIGTIMYQETEGKTDKSGSIVSFECGRPDQNKPLKIKVSFKNEGNAQISAEGIMNIIDAEGNIFGRKELGPIDTLPGSTREYETEWLGELEEGEYDVIVTFDAGLDIPLVAETTIKVGSFAEIDKLAIDTSGEVPVIAIIINNTGNLNARIGGKIDILNETGEVIESVPIKKTLVAPNSKKELKTEPEKALPAGQYKAKAIVSFNDKELRQEEAFSVR